jgi:hypothetical protein
MRDRTFGLLVLQEAAFKPLYISLAKLIAQRDPLIVWRFIALQGGSERHCALSD